MECSCLESGVGMDWARLSSGSSISLSLGGAMRTYFLLLVEAFDDLEESTLLVDILRAEISEDLP